MRLRTKPAINKRVKDELDGYGFIYAYVVVSAETLVTANMPCEPQWVQGVNKHKGSKDYAGQGKDVIQKGVHVFLSLEEDAKTMKAVFERNGVSAYPILEVTCHKEDLVAAGVFKCMADNNGRDLPVEFQSAVFKNIHIAKEQIDQALEEQLCV